MPKSKEFQRLAWEDRFNTPAALDLRAALDREAKQLFDRLRKHLLEGHELRESCGWYGECWRWSLEYRTARQEEAVVLLIPSPADLQLAMLIDEGFSKVLPERPLKRAVRDGLELALDPFDTRWGVWSVQPPRLVEDLKQLIDLKMRYLSEHAGG